MGKLMRRYLVPALLALALAPPAFGGTILFLGDSLTAGLGVAEEQAYPALIEKKIREQNLLFEVINASVSGDTTAGGLARLDSLLQKKIDVLVLALGANDGLRGLPVRQTKANLQAIIERVKAKNPGAKIVIAGAVTSWTAVQGSPATRLGAFVISIVSGGCVTPSISGAPFGQIGTCLSPAGGCQTPV